MSTYTTNYNLEKPDSTDDFKDFRSNYNSNMDIIDANLGGGGSSTLAGLTDVSITTPVTGDALIYDGAEWANTPLADVATSGDYTDLINTPTIPTALSDLSDDSTHRVVTDTQISTWNGKSDFSGSYNDLTDKPTIPTVNDGTLTIQQNGTTVGTFTANQSGNTTVNLSGGSLTETIDVGASSLAPNVTRWAKVGYFEKIDEASCTVLITGRADNGSNPWFSTIIDYSYATNTGDHIEQIHLEEEENVDFFIEDYGGYFYLWIFVAGLRMTDYGTWNITVLQSSDNQTIWHTDIQKDLSSTGHILWSISLGGYVARAGNVVQSDWNESDLFDMAYIKNKPDYFKVVYAGGQGILNFVFDDGN